MSLQDLTDYEKVNFLVMCKRDTFRDVCNSSKELNNLCNHSHYTQNIYEQRSTREFEDFIPYKEQDMKWSDFYKRMVQFIIAFNNYDKTRLYFFVYNLVKENSLMELKIFYDLYNNKVETIVVIATTAALLNRTNILDWLLNLEFVTSGIHDVEIQDEMASVDTEYDDLTDLIWVTAFFSVNLEVLNYLYKRGKIPNINDANDAAFEGMLHILQWIYSIDPVAVQDDIIRNTAIAREHYDIVEWLDSLPKL